MVESSRNNPWLFLSVPLFFLFIFFTTITHLSIAADTLSAGQSLSGLTETLTSKDENFELGFFTPGKSQNYYIGIWYKKISVENKTIVWVANREKPIKDPSSAEFRLFENGTLVVLDQSKTPIWYPNSPPSSTLNTSEVVLGDDGNLVMRDGLNKSHVIWQSFDEPTNTWLPGGKLGLNKRTNQTQLLTSWKNEEDPAPGIFSLELDPNGTSQYFIRWNRSVQFWTSGTWNGLIFSLVPEMRANYIYNFSYIEGQDENYFTYNLYNTSIISRFVMDSSGQINQLTWLESSSSWNSFWSQPRKACEVYGKCGSFGVCNQETLPSCKCLPGYKESSSKSWDLDDSTGGCTRQTPLQCGKNEGFLPMPKILQKTASSLSMNVGSAQECESTCLNRCTCNAYSYGSNGTNSCSLWDGDMLNMQQLADGDNGGLDLYLRLPASDIQGNGSGWKKKTRRWVIQGAVAGSLVLLALVLLLIWKCRKSKHAGASTTMEGSLVAFIYRDLQSATKNFSEKLGGGGFGSVFKGVLPDSTAIAVKKLEGVSQGEKQFRSEVSTIGTIQHVNLVRLRGFCSEGTKRLLVYDYMPKGSLDSHLFHAKDDEVLDWKTRYEIALGTARGLAYLHEKCRDCIIHCDIKPENILLDAQCCPKVADFGLAKLMGREFSRVLTTMRGTRGYLAPEWISGVAITAKADVYSYGMMLFEIISGRRNSEHSDEKIRFFPTWAATKMTESEDILDLVDDRLKGNADVEELTRACRVACWCIQDGEAHRPSMGQVVQILEGVLDVNPPPIPRSLHNLVENDQEYVHFFSESSNKTSQAQSYTSSASSQVKSSTSSMSSRT